MGLKEDLIENSRFTEEDFEEAKHGEIREENYAKFLTFYNTIRDSEGKIVIEEEVNFTNYNEKDTEAPDELAIHIHHKFKDGTKEHTLTMLPKEGKEKLKELLM